MPGSLGEIHPKIAQSGITPSRIEAEFTNLGANPLALKANRPNHTILPSQTHSLHNFPFSILPSHHGGQIPFIRGLLRRQDFSSALQLPVLISAPGQTEPRGNGPLDLDVGGDDFLARERAALGDDANQFATSLDTAATVEDGDDLLGGAEYANQVGGEQMTMFESSFPAIDSSNEVWKILYTLSPSQVLTLMLNDPHSKLRLAIPLLEQTCLSDLPPPDMQNLKKNHKLSSECSFPYLHPYTHGFQGIARTT
jgi:hypothetical protein